MRCASAPTRWRPRSSRRTARGGWARRCRPMRWSRSTTACSPCARASARGSAAPARWPTAEGPAAGLRALDAHRRRAKSPTTSPTGRRAPICWAGTGERRRGARGLCARGGPQHQPGRARLSGRRIRPALNGRASDVAQNRGACGPCFSPSPGRNCATTRGATPPRCVAVMLGVALAFSVHLINASALDEFSSAVRSVNGQPDLELRAAQGGFDEALFARVAAASAGGARQPGARSCRRCALDAASARVPLRVVGVDALVLPAIAPALMPRPRRGARPLRAVRARHGLPQRRRAQRRSAARRATRCSCASARSAQRCASPAASRPAAPPLAVMDIGARAGPVRPRRPADPHRRAPRARRRSRGLHPLRCSIARLAAGRADRRARRSGASA